MANYVKGSIQYTPVVEQINRKFCPRNKKCVAVSAGPVALEAAHYMGGGTQVLYRMGLGQVRRNFFFYRENVRSTGTSINEATARDKFKQGVQWAIAADKDVSVISANQIKLKTLAENPAAYITVDGEAMYAAGYTRSGFMRAFAIKAATAGVLPQDHNLPEVVIPA